MVDQFRYGLLLLGLIFEFRLRLYDFRREDVARLFNKLQLHSSNFILPGVLHS